MSNKLVFSVVFLSFVAATIGLAVFHNHASIGTGVFVLMMLFMYGCEMNPKD